MAGVCQFRPNRPVVVCWRNRSETPYGARLAGQHVTNRLPGSRLALRGHPAAVRAIRARRRPPTRGVRPALTASAMQAAIPTAAWAAVDPPRWDCRAPLGVRPYRRDIGTQTQTDVNVPTVTLAALRDHPADKRVRTAHRLKPHELRAAPISLASRQGLYASTVNVENPSKTARACANHASGPAALAA